MQKISLLLFFSICFSFLNSNAQTEPKARKSPMAVAVYKTDKAYMKVVYCQPSKRGREIFGGIVPYGKVWRTGANEATEITFTKRVKIGNKSLPAGTYSLFTIPEKGKWTIIFNKDLGMWGHYDYKASRNALQISVPIEKIKETWEAFTIKFQKNQKGAIMQLIWDNTLVELPIEIAQSKKSQKGK